jgi:hypothetical protein
MKINTSTRIGSFLECSRGNTKEKCRFKQLVWFKPLSSMYAKLRNRANETL